MGGAEKSLVSFLNLINGDRLKENNIKLYLLLADNGGAFTSQVPDFVELLETPKVYKNYVRRLSSIVKENPLDIISISKKLFWKFNTSRFPGDMSENEKYWAANNKYIPDLPGEFDYVLCYMNGTPTYYAADKIKSKHNYYWIHNEYEKLEYNDAFQRGFFEKADKLITISDRCADSLKKSFPDMSDKVEVIENISSKKMIEFQSLQDEPAEINPNEFNFISVGRLVEQKGYDIGIQAMKILKDKGVEFKWYILGEGGKREELKEMIDKEGLTDRIILLGNRSNPYAYIRVCDVFMQPSRFEGKSIALDEAKIMCKPILVTNYGTVKDSIENNVNGCISSMDTQDIALSLQRLIEDEELRDTLRDNLTRENTSNEAEIEKYYRLLGM